MWRLWYGKCNSSWTSAFSEVAFREMLLPSSGQWWEKCLSKRSLIKLTCLCRDKLIILWPLNRQVKLFLRMWKLYCIFLPSLRSPCFSNQMSTIYCFQIFGIIYICCNWCCSCIRFHSICFTRLTFVVRIWLTIQWLARVFLQIFAKAFQFLI